MKKKNRAIYNLFNDIEQMARYAEEKRNDRCGKSGWQVHNLISLARSSLSTIVDKYKHKIETFINIER